MTPIAPGLQVGRYIIRSKIGAGGMAEVYLADDTQLGRRVALKFLPPETEADTLAQRRLVREARSAATLDHPHICAVYEVGEAEGRTFIAMQYVEGETLDARLRRSPLALNETLAIAVHVVDALSEAHAHSILHRDIKPANIMVTTRGEAKVMDFGLAKITSDDPATSGGTETVSLLSARGAVIGTAPYMSPEQARGEALDPRSDLFSVGVLLYEMVSGQRPFQGTSSAAVAAAILTHEPYPLARFAPGTPAELERIVTKLLKKQPDSRYQTAKDLLIDLRTLKEEQEFQHRLGRTPAPSGAGERAVSSSSASLDQTAHTPSTAAASAPARQSLRPVLLTAAILVLAASGWFGWRAWNTRWATSELSEIAALSDAKDYVAAYDRAVTVEPYLRGDATLSALMRVIADTVSVTTTPPGASVYLTRFIKDEKATPVRQLVGTTPLSNMRVARGEYILSIEKEGFAPIDRTVSGIGVRVGALTITPPPIRLDQKLLSAAVQPPSMVFVPGGDYRLIAWSRPTDRRVRLTDFFIDKYEVSNREYKEFISGGGYLKRDLWKHAFVRDGRPVSWDEAMKVLVDRTGLPGPRSWSNQGFPDGKSEHPVSDVTWYEAEAYAAFRGKQLPSVFQWEKAARNGVLGNAGVAIMPWGVFFPGDALTRRANFGMATLPVSSSEFGMSPFGAYNMAGNVAEWTFNDSSEGFLATGGAVGDPTYSFAQFGGRPGFYSSEKLGFRCARNSDANAVDHSGERIEIKAEIPVYTATSPQVFATHAAAYRYEKAPLDARIEETQETPEWKRERITFNGANGARAIAYLYLPNHVTRPLQVMHFLPAGDVDSGFRSLPAAMEDRMAPFVRAGRAAFGVVLSGYSERLRPAGFVPPSATTVEYADIVVERITDLRRGLDYLETRPDIDATRIGAFAPSAGSLLGLILGAIETRYRAMVFMGAGLPAAYREAIIDVANPITFASHITVPKLLVQGRYDEDTALRSASEPLFKLLPEPKRMALFDGGHVASVEVLMSATSGWLDEKLGRVVR